MVIERVVAHHSTIFPLHLGVERLLSWAINQQSGLPNNDGDDSDGGDVDGNECDGDDGDGVGDGDGDGDGGDYQHHQQCTVRIENAKFCPVWRSKNDKYQQW